MSTSSTVGRAPTTTITDGRADRTGSVATRTVDETLDEAVDKVIDKAVDEAVGRAVGAAADSALAASVGLTEARPRVPARAAGDPPAAPKLTDPTGSRRHRGRGWSVPPWSRRLSGPALLFLVWLAVTGLDIVTERQFASPAAVIDAGRELWSSGDLTSSLRTSLYRVLSGCAIGVSVGLALAVLAGFFRYGEDVVDSSMNFLRTVPVIALLPLIILWIGIGEEAKIFLIALGVTFPIYMNTFAAIRGVDIKLVEAGQAFGLTRLGLIRRVIIPGAVPGFLVGLRWSLGVSWLLLVFAEQVNADSGIGHLLNQAQGWNRTDIIVLCLGIYGLLGLAGDGIVRLLERSLLSWRRGFSGT